MGAVKSFGGLVACRLLLGACEGGMFGGIILYLSMFYKRHNLMFRLGIFYCAAPLSGAFGGLLATGLSQINYHGYKGWVCGAFDRCPGVLVTDRLSVALDFLHRRHNHHHRRSRCVFLLAQHPWICILPH